MKVLRKFVILLAVGLRKINLLVIFILFLLTVHTYSSFQLISSDEIGNY